MRVDYFITLYDYNDWATQRIMRAAAPLSDAQLAAPAPHCHGSLRGTLVHTLSAEWIWRSRWQGTSPPAPLAEDEFPTLAAIGARRHEEQRRLRDFLAALRDEDLARVVAYTDTRGQPMAEVLWHLLAHVVNHGTQHRSEAAAMLTELGHSPGDLDMIVFFREQGRAAVKLY